MKKQPKLTPAMREALKNMAAGRPPRHGLVGRSAHGGFTRTMGALKHHGWADWKNDITDAGRKALEPGT